MSKSYGVKRNFLENLYDLLPSSCVYIASSGIGSCAAEHCELRQGRKAATVSRTFWVTRGSLVFWRGDVNTRIFYVYEIYPKISCASEKANFWDSDQGVHAREIMQS